MPWSKWKRSYFGRSPITAVEFILAVSTIVAGVYILSPVLALSAILNGASSLALTLGSQVGIYIFGGVFLSAGIANMVGLYLRNYRLRATSLFIQTLVRLYALFGHFLVHGFLPLSWLAPLTLIFICVICYLFNRGLIVRGGDR